MKIVHWANDLLEKYARTSREMGHSYKYNFVFHGLRIWPGIYIGIFDTRLQPPPVEVRP